MKSRKARIWRVVIPLLGTILLFVLTWLVVTQTGRQRNGLDQYILTAGLDDQEFDTEAACNYVRYHHSSSGIQSYDEIRFAGVFYEPTDLEKVKFRIYHILDKNEVVACFYANYDTGLIEQSGNSPSPVFSLMNRLDLQGIKPKAIRFTIVGLDEAILIENNDGEYFIATLLAPELRSTGADSLSAVNAWFERRLASHDN